MHIAILGDRSLSVTRHHRKQMIEFISGTIKTLGCLLSAITSLLLHYARALLFAASWLNTLNSFQISVTSALVVETSVTNESPFQKYHYQDDDTRWKLLLFLGTNHLLYALLTEYPRYFEYFTWTSFVSRSPVLIFYLCWGGRLRDEPEGRLPINPSISHV